MEEKQKHVSGAQKKQVKRERVGELAYYLTLVKIEGHTTWRANLSGHVGGFNSDWNNGKHPRITEKTTIRIDRISGELRVI